jgi:hypothetical protein
MSDETRHAVAHGLVWRSGMCTAGTRDPEPQHGTLCRDVSALLEADRATHSAALARAVGLLRELRDADERSDAERDVMNRLDDWLADYDRSHPGGTR